VLDNKVVIKGHIELRVFVMLGPTLGVFIIFKLETHVLLESMVTFESSLALVRNVLRVNGKDLLDNNLFEESRNKVGVFERGR
jgi:hypothetical protein